MEPKVHYRVARGLDRRSDVTACGLSGFDAVIQPRDWTSDPMPVSCRRCRKSSAYRRAVSVAARAR